MKKYEMTSNVKEFFGHKLFQVKALKDFGDVNAGDLGGYIEKERNLSQEGNAWVYRGAQVFGNAKIICNAQIFDNAQVFGEAKISDNAQVYGEVWIRNNAWIFNDARISNNANYIYFGGFGSKNGNMTMFRTKNGDIYVNCDRFRCGLEEFEEKVKKTHGDTKYVKEYLTCIEVAKIHFEIDG